MKSIEFINDVIRKRYYFLFSIVCVFLFLVIFTLFKLALFNSAKYENLLDVKTGKVYTGKLGERGKIYDRNGKLLVGNKEVEIITYLKQSSTNQAEEIEMAKLISENIKLDYSKVSVDSLKQLYLINNEKELKEKLSENIKSKYLNREITSEEYKDFLYEIIMEDKLNQMSESDKKIAYVYDLMNKGYKSSSKVIKNKELLDNEKEFIIKNKDSLNGFQISIRYERYYPYKEVFRDYLGNLGPIPKEEINKRLEEGYSREDIVGISYLEKQYEEYLRAQNEIYTIDASGKKNVVKEAHPGKDLILSIDINLQKEVEKIIVDNIKTAKKDPGTKYYNRAYAIISNPQNGEILAAAGKGVIKTKSKYETIDYLKDLTTVSVTPGSIVKGASHLVGYKTGAIKFGYTLVDSCIKLKNTPKKCSWKRLGKIDDLTALKYSSNYYQFMIAIKVGKGKYSYNSPISLDNNAFKIYRKMFNQFGLGVKTGIDLPKESIGFIGNDTYNPSILDFPIGQYDTYTPMQILQYINTLAMDGLRIAPHFLKSVYDSSEKPLSNLYMEFVPTIMNKVDVEDKYIARVQKGLKLVLQRGGTASGYIDLKYDPAGKTGTSQNFMDFNSDGKIETETISRLFGAYAPSDNPKVSILVISPHISTAESSYRSRANTKISKEVSKLYFKKYY